MHPDFNLSGHEGFQITPSLPNDYRGMILRGAKVMTANSSAGVIILQQLDHSQYSINYSIFNFLQSVKISGKQRSAMLVAFLALKNNIRYSIKGFGLLQLRQGQFALLHSIRGCEITSAYEKEKEYHTLEVSWSEEMLKQALPYFPFLKVLFSPKTTLKSFYVQPPGLQAGTKALNLVNELLKTPYNDTLNKLYFEHKVREYLLLLLVEAGKKPSPKINLIKEQQDKIIALGTRLSNEPDKKFPIADLAVEMQMNEMKLKVAFKEVFGQGIFEYQLEARMKEAQRLLRETDLSTKAIAGMVGYELTTSFITRFREYFGYPPGDITRNK